MNDNIKELSNKKEQLAAKQIELNQFNLPPRRIPSRTFDQSYEWCKKYIWPAFIKAGWLVEEKK